MSGSNGGSQRRIDRILTDGFLDGLDERGIDEVRVMRDDCAQEEALASYERRLLHGRLDLLRFERDRRAGKVQGSLVDNLASILSEERRPTRGAFLGQDPDLESFREPTRRISKLIDDDTLSRLPTLSDDDIEAKIAEFEQAEQETSGIRAQLLPILDKLNDEIGRRYASGSASPSDAR